MKLNNETQIGLLVCAVGALLAVLTLKTGNFSLSKSGYTVKARFHNIDGVNLNSPVMFNGWEVGIVDDIVISDDEGEAVMELTLRISQAARLRTGAKAYIKNLGFMGEKYVGLTSGDKGGAYVAPGALVVGQEPPNFEKLFLQGQEIAERLQTITMNIDERLEINKGALDSTLANLSVTMENLTSIASSTERHLSANERKIDDTISNFHSLSMNLEELSYDLKLNPWKIMYRAKNKKRKGQEE